MFELVAPCHFGLEAVLKRELTAAGYEILRTEDGRVTFLSDEAGIARANINLRTTERILIKAAEFNAESFDELFEGIRAVPWERYVPEDGSFWVKKASSINSKLFSPSDIQSIVKKAMVEELKTKYKTDWFEETGPQFPVRIFIHKDRVLVTLDTTGESLHKRGYRPAVSKAPISETLAAALLMLTPWKPGRLLTDPFCGSGTFPIEAAMIEAKIAPGLNRSFLSQNWAGLIKPEIWKEEFEKARETVNTDISEITIAGFDIDGDVIKIARENAVRAGVEKLIHFQQKDVKDLIRKGSYGFIITNPPYGERLEDKEDLPLLYRNFGDAFRRLDSWSAYFITAYEDAERYFGQKAAKNRKIYNGMMKTYFYQYPGPRPPKNKKNDENKVKNEQK